MPFKEGQGIIKKKSQGFVNLPDEAFDPGRPENREWTHFRHLSPHHQKSRQPEAVISMKMTDSHNPERLDPELCLFQIDLTPFAGIEKIKLPLKPYHDRGKKPSGHRHHAP
jgi:hypothetical protein